MASIENKDLNKRIQKSQVLYKVIESKDFEEQLRKFNLNWNSKQVSYNPTLSNLFIQQGLLNVDNNTLTRSGLLFFSRVSIDFEFELNRLKVLDNKYKIIELLTTGKNSLIFVAEHISLGFKVVLKFIRPGAAEHLQESLKLIARNEVPNLVQPYDYFKVIIKDIFSNEVDVECVVFPFIEGVSLKHFLNDDQRPLNAHAIASFIKQVSNVLAYLETLGAYHGDLHEENIIVNTGSNGALSFNVIDVSYGVTGSLDSETCRETDMLFFRQHVWNFLSAQQRFLTKMSIRTYLGAEIFHIVSKVMSPKTKSFREIKLLFNENNTYKEYLIRKADFINEKFTPPGSFKLQRYEEITDPKVALKLFVPYPELLDTIRAFSNLVISGNRGSGKSTYLAAMAFFPLVDEPLVDYREIFGIYFPCRQGEFRLLSNDMIDYNELGPLRIKHVMVIKIIRRTLESISEGIERAKISEPTDFGNLKRMLSIFLGKDEIISLDSDVVSEIRNLVSIMVRIEMKELDNLFHAEKNALGRKLCSEIDVLEFFNVVKRSFKELSHCRFHLLFDDAGTPNIPIEAQRIINDFIVSSNPVYCVKLSTERYSYHFQTTTNKQLESGQDYYDHDISRIFFIGTKTLGLDPIRLEQYFYRIIEKRLEYFSYQSTDITKYLGNELVNLDFLVGLLSIGARNAYYSGWSIVWRVADRNPRNLLEIISEIFSVANVNKETSPVIIHRREQDRAIRIVSEKRLRSLSQISGVIDGTKYSLGQRLFDITSAIGSVYRIYLKSEIGKKRKDQYLAVERNDTFPLSLQTDILLQEMIKYGIFDDARMEFARDDRVKKPIYVLNRIYCPAFGIGLRRDQHLRLSHARFEELFLDPKSFVSNGTGRLRREKNSNHLSQNNLFDDFDIK